MSIFKMIEELYEDELVNLYAWVDSIPLSRPKKNIARDFADGVLAAEVVHHYFPRMIELHNYPSASNSKQKLDNWMTLNQKVFRKLGFSLQKHVCEAVAFGEPGAVEQVLKLLQAKLAAYQSKKESSKATKRLIEAKSKYDEQDHAEIGYEDAAMKALTRLHVSTSPRKTALGTCDADDMELIRSYKNLEEPESSLLQKAYEVNRLLEEKVSKLEALLRLKDAKINALLGRLEAAGYLAIDDNTDM